jgi:PPOX class probable F420-dependent enzyme
VPGRLETPWPLVRLQLEQARSYWISTTRPDLRPHSAPVWAVWVDGRLWFSTSPSSVKARNIAANPAVAVHLPSADDAVLLEGSAEIVRDTAVPPHVDAAYAAKYVMPDSGDPCHLVEPQAREAVVVAVSPQVGHTWLERAFAETMTRWRWSPGSDVPAPEPNSYG